MLYGVSPALFGRYRRRASFGFLNRSSQIRRYLPRTAIWTAVSPRWRKIIPSRECQVSSKRYTFRNCFNIKYCHAEVKVVKVKTWAEHSNYWPLLVNLFAKDASTYKLKISASFSCNSSRDASIAVKKKLTLSATETLAPFSSRRETIAVCFFCVARIRGVSPSYDENVNVLR